MKNINKNVLMLLALIFCTTLATTQVDTSETVYADTVRRVKIDVDRGGENKYVNVIRRKRIKTRVSLLEVGLNTLVNTSDYKLENGINPFDLDIIKSKNITYYPYMQRISLIKRKLNLIHGLGIQYYEYNFQNPVRLLPKNPQTEFTYQDNLDLKKNKLKILYLSLPVMLNLETNPFKYSRSFRLSAGVEGGLRVRSWTKRKSDEFGKVKSKDDFNLNQFKLAVRGEIGVGIFNLFGTLNVTELFDIDQNNGYEIYPLTIGVKLLPF